MTLTMILILNLTLSILVVAAVAALTKLAHRLPESAPHTDEAWGTAGDPWVASDPLPFAQLAAHEADRALARAA